MFFSFPRVWDDNSDRMTCNLFWEGLCDSRIQRGGTTHGLFLPEEPLRKSRNGQPIRVISINRAHCIQLSDSLLNSLEKLKEKVSLE